MSHFLGGWEGHAVNRDRVTAFGAEWMKSDPNKPRPRSCTATAVLYRDVGHQPRPRSVSEALQVSPPAQMWFKT